MYIIDRLNETILEKYHVVISSSVSVFENHHSDENLRLIDHYSNPDATYTTDAENLVGDLLGFVTEYIELLGSIHITPEMLYESISTEVDHIGFWIMEILNKHANKPTSEEMLSWQKDREPLYNYDTQVVVSINGTKISNAILMDLMFTGYKKQ